MNIASASCRRRRVPAFSIIECLVYIGLSVVLLGAAFIAFSRSMDNTKRLRRNADDITRAMHVGELWRLDIRAAAAGIQLNEETQTIRIPKHGSEVWYRFTEAQVWRKASPDAEWASVLPNVKQSQMRADPRTRVKAWRWELELQGSGKSVRVRPLFTFLAVPAIQP